MKTLAKFFAFLLFFIGINSNTYSNSPMATPYTTGPTLQEVQDKVINHLKSGDIAGLSQLMASEITLSLNDRDSDCTPAKAQQQLDVFFTQNPIKSFEKLHQGNSKNGAEQFLIGQIKTTNQGVFRIYVLLKQSKILEISITED